MENVHTELCTLFVMRGAVDQRFAKLADSTLAGSAFNRVDLLACDFLPWEVIGERLKACNYRTAAKFRRFVRGVAIGELDSAVLGLGKNALLNKGVLTSAAINRTLVDGAIGDYSIIRHRVHLSPVSAPSEKSDCVNLFRLIDFLEVDKGHQKQNKTIQFTASALAFFRSF